jgi:hypothetical protein
MVRGRAPPPPWPRLPDYPVGFLNRCKPIEREARARIIVGAAASLGRSWANYRPPETSRMAPVT